MAMTIGGMLQIFKEAGLSSATIQRENITHAQVSNLFWINLCVSGTVSLMMAISAPIVARFFHEPELVKICLVLSSVFLLNGLAVQHMALLNRHLRFATVAMIGVASTAVGVGVGVSMALLNCGYWSLIGVALATPALKVVAAWSVWPWRPQAPRRRCGTRSLVSFGADLTLVGIFYSLSRESDGLLIGRSFGSEAVGLYSRASVLLTRPLEQLIAPLSSVVVPALSRLQAQPERYRRIFLQVFEGLAIAGCLFTGLFLPLAEPLTTAILGQKWQAASPIFAALTVAALYVPLSSATSWLYISQGRGRDLLLTAVIGACVMVSSFAAGLPFGPTGVAIAYSVSGAFLQLPLTFHIGGRRGPVSAVDLFTAATRHLPICAVVLAATFIANTLSPVASPLNKLLVCAPFGLLAGIVTTFLFPPSRQAATRIISQLKVALSNPIRVAW